MVFENADNQLHCSYQYLSYVLAVVVDDLDLVAVVVDLDLFVMHCKFFSTDPLLPSLVVDSLAYQHPNEG